jgi:hypothetical protein
MRRPCAVTGAVAILAAILPGLAGAKAGADVLAENLGWIHQGSAAYWIATWTGAVFAALIAAGGAMAFMGCFERDDR